MEHKKKIPFYLLGLLLLIGFFFGSLLVTQAAEYRVSIGNTTMHLNDTGVLSINGTTNLSGIAWYNGAEICTGTSGACLTSSNLTSYATTTYVNSLGNFSAANSTLARTGTCPVGFAVQNTTTSGVQCVNVSGVAGGGSGGGWSNTSTMTYTGLFVNATNNMSVYDKFSIGTPIGLSKLYPGYTFDAYFMSEGTITNLTKADFVEGSLHYLLVNLTEDTPGYYVYNSDYETVIDQSMSTDVGGIVTSFSLARNDGSGDVGELVSMTSGTANYGSGLVGVQSALQLQNIMGNNSNTTNMYTLVLHTPFMDNSSGTPYAQNTYGLIIDDHSGIGANNSWNLWSQGNNSINRINGRIIAGPSFPNYASRNLLTHDNTNTEILYVGSEYGVTYGTLSTGFGGISVAPDYRGTGDPSNSVYGLNIYPSVTGNGKIDTLTGGFIGAFTDDNANVTHLYAANYGLGMYGNSSTLGAYIVYVNDVYTGGTPTIPEAYGVYINPITAATSNYNFYSVGNGSRNRIEGHLAVGAYDDPAVKSIITLNTNSSVYLGQFVGHYSNADYWTGTDFAGGGLQVYPGFNGTNATTLYGATLGVDASGGNIEDLYGGILTNSISAGTVLRTRGSESYVQQYGGTVTNMTAHLIGNAYRTGGTTTNQYGLYIRNQTGATNNFNLYSEGNNSRNVFEGNISITGTNSCLNMPGGGKICGNTTCLWIQSPDGLTTAKVANNATTC